MKAPLAGGIMVSTAKDFVFSKVEEAVASAGFAFVRGPDTATLLNSTGEDLAAFAASWDDLGEDRHMADGGRYRRRRHATFDVSSHSVVRRPHQPHYQDTRYNELNGGIERWFEPVREQTAANPLMRAALTSCRDLFETLTPPAERPESWFVEVHQFRIEASGEGRGQPTPEGAHRDGVDWVFVMLLARHNIVSGVTTISDLDRKELGSFMLTEALDTAIVDDARRYHGVTAVEPLDPTRRAYRDVLVITFRGQPRRA